MKKLCFIAMLIALATGPGLAQSVPDGLDRLLAADMLPAFRSQPMLQASSYDRTGGNDDGFGGTYSTIRMENGEYVFFETTGPGTIYRIWTASYHGVISVYFDGAAEPAFRAPIQEFLDGRVPPLKPNLCQFASGGLCCYFPLEYEKSIKLTLDEKPLFFHVDYAAAEQPNRIVSSTPQNLQSQNAAIAKAVDLLANRGESFYHGPLEKSPFTVDLAPNQSVEIWNATGSGTIRSLFINPLGTRPIDFKKTVLRIYWDGQNTPAVDVSLLRFFAMDFEFRKFRSLFVGYRNDAFYSFFPMPFRTGARAVLMNESDNRVNIAGAVEFSMEPVPENFGYFHAAGHATVTEKDKPIVINAVSGGRGHWVGTAVSVMREKGDDDHFRYLEGDEHVYVDGRNEPLWSGTGTEDYFNGGWYFMSDEFSRSFYGAPIISKTRSRTVMYRFHETDAIPFQNSIRFELEHGNANEQPGVLYDVVGYWYQDVPGETGL